MDQMFLWWLYIKFVILCVSLFYIVWKKVINKSNALYILLIIFISGLLSYKYWMIGIFEAIATPLFVLLCMYKKIPVFSKNSIFLYLFIISSQIITFIAITYRNIYTCQSVL